ncbi:predicted protein [Naegleria gruberi]|uniref:Predicted protein n=1 Tax=Naegleria gruberi TaxID=5762 RepID=D2VRN3_NAEGR|nr:uncharacterized protein NAEGRDRAFT_51717 [Naegleria gruberi]EFC40422.1 predicted protein [Naegleria gruberi]|eukprot:XP_002673166.1 predicted protein [Naegleria gruberi strain NEG-M]
MKSFKGYERVWYPPMNEESSLNYSSSNQHEKFPFSLISYNILAQALCNRQGSQKYLTKSQARWNIRRNNLLNEISHYNSDLISLQECDFYDSFWKSELERLGYETLYSQQFNCEKNYQPMPYGLLTAFKKDKFKLLEFVVLDYQKEALKDVNITDIEIYEAKLSGNIALISVLSPIDHPEKVLILSNTHLYWRPACNSVRVRQALILMQTVQKLKETYDSQSSYESVEYVCTGDYNTSPNDPPYILLTTRNPSNNEPFKGDYNAVKLWEVINNGTDDEFIKEFPLVFVEEIKLVLESKLQMESSLQLTSNSITVADPLNGQDCTSIDTVSRESTEECNQGIKDTVVSQEEVERIFKEQYQQRIRNIKQCIHQFSLSLPIISLYTFYNSHCDKEEDIKAMKVHERWSNNDLPYTTYTPHYISTLDYVFVSENSTLSLTHLLSVPTPQQIQEEHSQLTQLLEEKDSGDSLVWIPNDIHSSDHFSLGVRMSQ